MKIELINGVISIVAESLQEVKSSEILNFLESNNMKVKNNYKCFFNGHKSVLIPIYDLRSCTRLLVGTSLFKIKGLYMEFEKELYKTEAIKKYETAI